MAFNVEDLIRIRPYVFHLTDSRNIPRIRRLKALEPASRLLRQGGREDLLGVKRPSHIGVSVGSDRMFLRDQMPLHAGNMGLTGHWTLKKSVHQLNDRVFLAGNPDRAN